MTTMDEVTEEAGIHADAAREWERRTEAALTTECADGTTHYQIACEQWAYAATWTIAALLGADFVTTARACSAAYSDAFGRPRLVTAEAAKAMDAMLKRMYST